MIVVPEEFAVATIAREGSAGRNWIAEIPALVAELCKRWQMVVDGEPMHGYLGLVVPVRRNGESCVMKLSWRDQVTREEAVALQAWNGHGAARLLEADASVGAMVLERLDWSRRLEHVGIEEALSTAGRLLRCLAIPAPAGIRSQTSLAQEIAQTLTERWEQSSRPIPRQVLDRAGELAIDYAIPHSNLLVNYDLHYGDVLAGEREPWLAVDPKVVAGDPEFGIAQLLWQRLEDIEARGGLERLFPILTDAAELDPALSRDWMLVRCVDYWLWGLDIGLTYDPARCKRIVEWST